MVLSSVESDVSPNYMKQLKDVQDLLANWNTIFSMDDEREKLRMKEAANDLASIVSSLNLGSEETTIEEYVQLAKEENVGAKYNMAELVDPLVKLPQAHEYAQILSNVSMEHPSNSLIVDGCKHG